MTKERFKEHYESDGGAFLVIPGDGRPPYRMDGKPLDDGDRALLAGKDPLGDPAPGEEEDEP